MLAESSVIADRCDKLLFFGHFSFELCNTAVSWGKGMLILDQIRLVGCFCRVVSSCIGLSCKARGSKTVEQGGVETWYNYRTQ